MLPDRIIQGDLEQSHKMVIVSYIRITSINVQNDKQFMLRTPQAHSQASRTAPTCLRRPVALTLYGYPCGCSRYVS